MKQCRRCGESKSLDQFSPHRNGSQGRYAYCRLCAASQARARNSDATVRARKAAAQRERRRDPSAAERDRATSKAWKAAHPERTRAHNRTPEKLTANIAWNRANPERRRAAARAYQASHPEVVRVSQQKRRARKLGTDDSLTAAEWRSILEEFNHSCAYCLANEVPLQQEHMTPLSRGGAHNRANVVPACGPCNYRKHTRTLLEFLAIGGRAA